MQFDNYRLIEALKGKKPLDITLTPAPEWVGVKEKVEVERMYKGRLLDRQEVGDESR